MEKYREFLSHAHECEQLAKTAPNPELRQEWEKLAQTWRSLATERHKMIKPPSEPENTSH